MGKKKKKFKIGKFLIRVIVFGTIVAAGVASGNKTVDNEKNNIARQMVREQNKEARMQNKKKKFRIQDQSLRDSIMGVNDPNAVTHKVKKRLFNR